MVAVDSAQSSQCPTQKPEAMMHTQPAIWLSRLHCARRPARLTCRPISKGSASDTVNRLNAVRTRTVKTLI